MAVINKIIHRFVRNRAEYMDPTKELYNQIIPYNVQAYSYELKPNGDPNIPDDYTVRYVLGTGRSTYAQIANGQGRDIDGNAIPELSKEFVINSTPQLIKFINDLIDKKIVVFSYITSDINGNPFATKADLDNAIVWYNNGESVLPNKNDYTIVTSDESRTIGGQNPTTRYVCVGIENERPVWDFQYVVNNTDFTEEQLAAINSGITENKVNEYDICESILIYHVLNENNPHGVTKNQIGLDNVDNTSDINKPISTATQNALDNIGDTLDSHINDQYIHVTPLEKVQWNSKQDSLKIGDHIKITNDTISVLDDLSTYNNSISRFINKSTDELENYYTKDELSGIYKYIGEVPTYNDLPTGNVYAPDIYQELMYLTADQLEYINTNYHPNQRTVIEIKFVINGSGNNYLYGTDIEHEDDKVAFGINYGQTIANAFFGNKNVSFNIDNQVHTLIQNKLGVYLDSEKISEYTNIDDFVTESSLWLFRAQTSDTHPQNISIYEVKIYEVDELVKQYIPVLRREDNALGMYEVLSEEFKQNEYNLKEFDFIPGPYAGYKNVDGNVYKVIDTQNLYMWHNHEWILTEKSEELDNVTIQRQNGALTVIGMKTKSDDIMYDWIGTLEEWEEGRDNGTIPDEWICWITDDEEEPAGIANLAQVASSGEFEDLKDIPPLPVDKLTKNYLLIWDHRFQKMSWVETDIQPSGEYDPETETFALDEVQYDANTNTLETTALEPMEII